MKESTGRQNLGCQDPGDVNTEQVQLYIMDKVTDAIHKYNSPKTSAKAGLQSEEEGSHLLERAEHVSTLSAKGKE